jgi:hypothetical protein
MTATSRYWDCERCAWVSYETTAATEAPCTADLAAETLPGQRADDETLPAPLGAP